VTDPEQDQNQERGESVPEGGLVPAGGTEPEPAVVPGQQQGSATGPEPVDRSGSGQQTVPAGVSGRGPAVKDDDPP